MSCPTASHQPGLSIWGGSLLNKLTLDVRGIPARNFREGIVAVPRNDKFKDYARYVEHCLSMMAATRDQELRCIQREMAAEWIRLADTIRPRKSKQMQMG